MNRNEKLLNLLVEKAEELGWNVDFGEQETEYGTLKNYAEFSQYSPAGEDFLFNVFYNGSADDLSEQVSKYCYNFDVDEHIEMWVEAKKGGDASVPSVKILIDDAEAIEEMLKTLVDELQEVLCEELKEAVEVKLAESDKSVAFPDKETVRKLREKYTAGSRVVLVKMDDPQAPPVGTKGTVTGVDDAGSVLVNWDNGCGLNVVYGKDRVDPVHPDTVWVVRTDRMIDGCNHLTGMQIFANKDKAKAEFDRLVNDDKYLNFFFVFKEGTNENDSYLWSESENYWQIWKNGSYCKEHSNISLEEIPIKE